jgi:hypothetical protein
MMSVIDSGAFVQHRRHSVSGAASIGSSFSSRTDDSFEQLASPLPVPRLHNFSLPDEEESSVDLARYFPATTTLIDMLDARYGRGSLGGHENVPNSRYSRTVNNPAVVFTNPFADALPTPPSTPARAEGSRSLAQRSYARRSSIGAPYGSYAKATYSPYSSPSPTSFFTRRSSANSLDAVLATVNCVEENPFLVKPSPAPSCNTPQSMHPTPLRQSSITEDAHDCGSHGDNVSANLNFLRADRRQSAPPAMIKDKISSILYPFLSMRDDASATLETHWEDASSDGCALSDVCKEIAKGTGESCAGYRTVNMNDIIDSSVMQRLSPAPMKLPSVNVPAEGSPISQPAPINPANVCNLTGTKTAEAAVEPWQEQLASLCRSANLPLQESENADTASAEKENVENAYPESLDGTVDAPVTQEPAVVMQRRLSHSPGVSCSVCNRSFSKINQLKSHMKCHFETRSHACATCNLTFLRLHDLRRHELTHTGTRCALCTKCGNTFSRKDALMRHMRTNPNCDVDPVMRQLHDLQAQIAKDDQEQKE